MQKLKGRRIGIAASRQGEAITKLIEKQGGTGSLFSIQGKQLLNEADSRNNVQDFIQLPFDWAVLTTGIGAKTLENSAESIQEKEGFLNKLSQVSIAVRGSKTLRWMKEHSLEPLLTSEDGTMENLFQGFKQEHKGSRVFLQAYNQDDAALQETLEKLGYTVYLSKPYQYEKPEDEILDSLIQHIYDRALDAVVFTSKTQVQNLFRSLSDPSELVRAFQEHVLPVAVGKVTAKELEKNGLTRVIQPEQPKMGAMVMTLADYYK
ncbi:uroporphyrinogen-III synthase [Halobacillus rhizosphaerae]|uniref:uroporphyrinogen-III synthase n=1 Tax=Halobacillus rhizosphaerae TaxID=3064889 RepID=UPI00398B310A